jgi:hypothetical protein
MATLRPAHRAVDTAQRACDALEHWGRVRTDADILSAIDDSDAAFQVSQHAWACLLTLSDALGQPRYLAALAALEVEAEQLNG